MYSTSTVYLTTDFSSSFYLPIPIPLQMPCIYVETSVVYSLPVTNSLYFM